MTAEAFSPPGPSQESGPDQEIKELRGALELYVNAFVRSEGANYQSEIKRTVHQETADLSVSQIKKLYAEAEAELERIEEESTEFRKTYDALDQREQVRKIDSLVNLINKKNKAVIRTLELERLCRDIR